MTLFYFQEVLMKRLGPNAHLVNLKLNHAVPASVRLQPAKEYRGAAIGINYDLRIYTGKVYTNSSHNESCTICFIADVSTLNEIKRISSLKK